MIRGVILRREDFLRRPPAALDEREVAIWNALKAAGPLTATDLEKQVVGRQMARKTFYRKLEPEGTLVSKGFVIMERENRTVRYRLPQVEVGDEALAEVLERARELERVRQECEAELAELRRVFGRRIDLAIRGEETLGVMP